MEKYIKKFPSGSFVKTWLIKKNNSYFVRKEAPKINKFIKNRNLIYGQYIWIKNMQKKNISVPEIKDFIDKKNKIYYDMQYLDHSISLNYALKKKKVRLKSFFLQLKKFYRINTELSKKNVKLFSQICKVKAIPSILSLREKRIGNFVLKKKYIYINEIKCLNLISQLNSLTKKNNKFSKIISDNFDSKKKTLVHGDLTFENILLKDNKFYLIDPYGGNVDIRANNNFLYKSNLMFDLGKICQSLVANYENWKNVSSIKKFYINKKFFLSKEFMPLLKKDFYLLKSIFGKKEKNFNYICLMHMIIHLCRLIRYRVKHNYSSALLAYVIATYCVNVLINDNHTKKNLLD